MNQKLSVALLFAVSSIFSVSAFSADRLITTDKDCSNLPTFAQLQAALTSSVVASGGGTDATATTGGLGFPMWAALVNSSGRVCAMAKIGGTDPWPGSRVIAVQKANTANAFSNEKLALSTANLFSAVQPGGSLFGLQHSNPVNPVFAYAGDATTYGTANDPLAVQHYRVGGVNVFGGGLALYDTNKRVIGAIGVSGDTSCADHQIAWKLRGSLAGKGAVAAKVPGGVNTVGALGANGDDNIIFDIVAGTSTSGFGHTAGCLTQKPPLAGNVSN